MHRRLLLLGLPLLAALPAAARAPRRTQDPDVVFPEAGRRAWAAEVPQIRIGLLGGENEADRLGRFGEYRALMERTFAVPVRLYPAGDYAGVIQAFGARQVELASMSPSAYAGAWLDTRGGVEPLVVTEEEDGTISYVAVMVVRADSGITSLEEMRGRSIAWSDPNSASGYLIPRFALRRQGISPERFFGRTGFGGGHEQAIVAVLQRQYDAAVTWASGIGDESRGFTRGTLRAMVEKGMLNMDDLRIIWRSEPIINGPQTVRADLPDAFKEDMRLFHLALPKAHPAIYRQIERGGGAGYREVSHADYELMVAMRREEAAERRRRG
ncbi:phosphate/phosphite/phosphonate ABC transporter substrate-binding protein [Crenalkalicoccus roseus]|uniref:phosphate/phosphite/phosphonate ABC transporter substrate-binding protein n=1 Tax=Crenalkalicoccus roseus TaxID=1485588 RepID=UPI0010800ED2|nr:phosphate/phosphite/phosphonate ABC transporter substrate-binding protein [Crenalkalicoccus roseus]